MVRRSLMIRLSTLLIIGAIAAFGIWGCSDSDVTGPTAPDQSEAYLKSAANPNIRAVMAIQDRHTPALMADPDVVATATTIDETGHPAILLLVLSERARRGAPAFIDDVRVITQITDRIVAMKGPPSGGDVDHKAKQTTPIQLGTSGGWRYDLANGYCCGGTLGALIQVGGSKRILSNYHVFEADIVDGGNGRVATTGDPIVQPGLIDIGCVATNGQDVATLVVTSSLPGNNVDCSSANIIIGMVDPSGAILEVGTLSAQTVAAYIGQAVKKSGRTTGLTRSSVTGLNGTVSIAYENECAGGSAFSNVFTGQIIIANRGSKFLSGGDSGSLMIQDLTTDPGAVGLLFAGSSQTAIANPIDEVLAFLGATMVGN